jgi:hypothetical protein
VNFARQDASASKWLAGKGALQMAELPELSPELVAFLEEQKRKHDAKKRREAQEKAERLTKELWRTYGPLNR